MSLPSDPLADFYVHTVTATPYLGEGAYGPAYGDTVSVPCFIDDSRKSVRTPGGDEVVSEATLYAPSDHLTDLAPETRVTLWGGSPAERTATVLTLKRHDSGALNLPDHLEVALT